MTLPSSSVAGDARHSTVENLFRIRLSGDKDLVVARQGARQCAQLLGFESQDQVRIATAVSEIVRECLLRGLNATLAFYVHRDESALAIELECRMAREAGDDFATEFPQSEGFVMARRFLGAVGADVRDEFLCFTFRRPLPAGGNRTSPAMLSALQRITGDARPGDLKAEFEAQTHELLETLTELRNQQNELAKLNRELEETNRGVVALYAELEDQADSLRRASEQKIRFYSSISHEFRTPITSILSLSQILLDRLDGPLTDEQEQQVTLIRKCGQNLLEWVNDLLDLARVDAGRMEVRISTVPVRDLLASLRGVMRPLVTSPDVQLVIDEQGVSPALEIATDEGKVAQILRNLVANALKFTERGEVSVEVALPEGRPDWIAFVVRDTGVGIPAEDQERIFEEFVQLDGPLQRQRKGTGLGLPVCRRLAALLGGTVTVDSQPDVGSAFRLELPMEPNTSHLISEATSRSADQQPSAAVKRRRLLLIDDDDAWRYLVRQAISGLPVDMLEASNGGEGLKLATSGAPDAIILDLLMPELSGYEVLEILQQRPSTCSVPVIICTSEDVDPMTDSRLCGRVHSLIRKPIDGQGPARVEFEQALREAGVLDQEENR